MGVHIHLTYGGSLRCRLTHGPSNSVLETDAPVDNAGKGESFSPTDLLATALVSCAVTTMAIKAPREGIRFDGSKASVEKVMTGTGPRRIAELRAQFHLPASVEDAHRARLEEIARTCPVALSLSPDVKAELRFIYDL